MYNNRINEGVKVDGKITGWIVRETQTGFLEYGIWLTDSVFMGVPIDPSIKTKLRKITSASTNEYTYYIMDDIRFKLTKCTTVNNKTIPMLMEAASDEPSVFVAAFAAKADRGGKIIDVSIPTENVVVIRDYIDKNRDVVGIITANTTEGLINPSVTIKLTNGVIGSKSVDEVTYELTTAGSHSETVTITSEEPVATKFVSFNRFVPVAKKRIKSRGKGKNEKNDANKTKPATNQSSWLSPKNKHNK